MTNDGLLQKVKDLPPEIAQEVDDFIDFILKKRLRKNNSEKPRVSGHLKGKIWMSLDFDEPLEDMKDYM